VERVGGQDVSVNVMVGPGESPHSYEPKPEQMRALSDSTLYFLTGVEFEAAWMDRLAGTNPEMRLVDLSADIDKLPLAAHGHGEDEGNNQEDEDEEHENGLDPHVWTSPELVKGMAAAIARELAELNPRRADYYNTNLAEFTRDIEDLQVDIRTSLEPLESRKFMVFHPAWGYFANEFGLEQVAIEAGGTEPSASQLAALLDEAREEDITVVFAQPEFSTRSAITIAREIGGMVVLISPLEEDWLANLARIAQSLAENL
jgi:zinc transport system substrate-binding protein